MSAESVAVIVLGVVCIINAFVFARALKSSGMRVNQAMAEVRLLTTCVIEMKTPGAAQSLQPLFTSDRVRSTTAEDPGEEEEHLA